MSAELSSGIPERLIVIGSSAPLAPALAELHGPDNTAFFGRTNPYDLPNWQEGLPLDTDEGIAQTCEAVKAHTAELGVTPAHLVMLQGVSSTDWQSSIAVNMVSVAEIGSGFAEVNQDRSALGSIALIGSASAYLGSKLPYSTTKASLTGLMNGFNKAYGATTRTNLIVPGAMEGGMSSNWGPEKTAQIVSRTYANRIASAKEIADAILFCANNKYVCGSVINMTSGQVGIE